MKKKLNFVISFILILAMIIAAFAVPASSYENDVNTSSTAMLLVNLDTDTVCFSKRPDNKWYANYMSELVTFIVACESVAEPAEKKVRVTQEFIYSLPYSDGCLDKFAGLTLTLKDLLGIMWLTSGSDAAYLVADTVNSGDIEGFVAKMNAKATQLGCENTNFITPGYSESKLQYTTCRDLHKIFMGMYKLDLYKEFAKSPVYTPEGYESEDEEEPSDYEVSTENSFLNPASPFYFRYSTGGKYSYGPISRSNILVTTRYRGKSYLFIALRGKNTSEKNVFTDARRMTTWAYLNLSDRKVIDAEDTITKYNVTTDWGTYDVELFASNSAYKTLPMKYEADKFAYEFKIPHTVYLPVFEGQSIGTAKIFYDGEQIDDVNLISASSEGISLLGDVAHFGLFAFSEILANEPPTEAEEGTLPPTVPPTEAPTKKAKSNKSKTDPTKATSATEPAEG